MRLPFVGRLTGKRRTGKASDVRGYVICTAPRSGSNYLCQILEGTGVLGRPKEYFNGHGRRIFDDPDYPDDPGEQARRILSSGATPNGVYGLKIFAHQHDWISDQLRWTEALPGLSFIFLRREDLLGQAISWAKALQNGQYRTGQSRAGEEFYDADLIAGQLRAVVGEYARWELYFARNGIAPLRLSYETVTKDAKAAVRSVAELVGIRGGIAVDAAFPTVLIQRDAMSEDWRTRFLNDRADYDLVEHL